MTPTWHFGVAIILVGAFCFYERWKEHKKANIINTLFLQNWGFYEFTFLRDGPYFFKDQCPLCPMNGPLSFKNGLAGPLRLRASGVGTFKVRSLRGFATSEN